MKHIIKTSNKFKTYCGRDPKKVISYTVDELSVAKERMRTHYCSVCLRAWQNEGWK